MWITLPGFAGFAVGFLLWGFGGSLANGAFEALLYDGLAAAGAEEQYARVNGWVTAAGLVTQVPAAVAATLLFAAGGYALAGWVSVGLCLVAAAVATRLPEPPRSTSDAADRGYRATLRAGLTEAATDRGVRVALLAVATLTALDAIEEYFGLVAYDWGVPAVLVPLAIIAIPLAGAAGAALGGAAAQLAPRTLGLVLLLALGLVAAAGLAAHPAGLVAVTVFYGLYRMVLVVVDARLQEQITGPPGPRSRRSPGWAPTSPRWCSTPRGRSASSSSSRRCGCSSPSPSRGGCGPGFARDGQPAPSSGGSRRSSGRTAGPSRTAPSTSKREPWHGQSQLRSAPLNRTRQPRWVHRSDTACKPARVVAEDARAVGAVPDDPRLARRHVGRGPGLAWRQPVPDQVRGHLGVHPREAGQPARRHAVRAEQRGLVVAAAGDPVGQHRRGHRPAGQAPLRVAGRDEHPGGHRGVRARPSAVVVGRRVLRRPPVGDVEDVEMLPRDSPPARCSATRRSRGRRWRAPVRRRSAGRRRSGTTTWRRPP